MPNLSPHFEFHISRQARDQYEFDESIYSLAGSVVFANFRAARLFAQKMNSRRDLVSYPEQTVRAGQVNALGLIDEILHYVVRLYREQVDPHAMEQALALLDSRLGSDAVNQTLRRFADEFPTVAVYRRQVTGDEWLAGVTDGTPNREIALEELLMLWLANMNPATSPYRELFDDAKLAKETAYPSIPPELETFFASLPAFGPDHQPLIDMLRAPALAMPYSLSGQLQYILDRWGTLLGAYLARLLYRLLGALDLIKEENKLTFLGPGPAEVPLYEFRTMQAEPERFSPDKDWMPNLTMIAKNSYVWLDQLSRKYRRAITRLDQIPDEELDQLARWGFKGLWFIGIWERSRASQRIKRLSGNPDAVSSAYSLYDYAIAEDLGGDGAYENLRERAGQRGLRLASDMVPNHMGIDSKWVMEHPDWFVQLDYSPFPSYSFSGPDLSWDERIGVFVEDHYYDRTDAAVVFKRLDRWTGSEKFIYHGNDGTSFPWNDTAQLDYLKAEVREAVIQTILHVASKFSIIRFDAAMTLTKKHFQRLWFPEPGTGGAIPSRAEHGLTKAQFDELMPLEFWRQVVDRVAQQAPDTLLLAEAFWLLEGYFVRTLGMHRVYNSAFMHMLRDEDNSKYRSVIKNTIEFDPEILKRYVNFMNNPDERTALDQFGKGDKYFGVCTLLVTMPGLPMFGHGQIEGFSERYGMDFRHALWDEQPDPWLVDRHERQIFPLLHKRSLFAGVENFRLYDFYSPEGTVNEDVFAYSNRAGGERGLVIYHNKYAEARGRIRASAAYLDKNRVDRQLVQKTLGEGLDLNPAENWFTIFSDQITGLEYIRSSKDLCENGLYVELAAYKCHVFTNWREVQDNALHQYAHLNSYLNGRGAPSVEGALREILLQPVTDPFQDLVNADLFRRLFSARQAEGEPAPDAALLDEVEGKTRRLLLEIKKLAGGSGDEVELAGQLRKELETILRLPRTPELYPQLVEGKDSHALKVLLSDLDDDLNQWAVLFGWLFVHDLGRVSSDIDFDEQSRAWIDEWLLGKVMARAFQDLGMNEARAGYATGLVKILTAHQAWPETAKKSERPAYTVLENWLQDDSVQQFLHENRHQGILWFNKESFDQLLPWLYRVAVVRQTHDSKLNRAEAVRVILDDYRVIAVLQRAERDSAFQVERLLAAARNTGLDTE